MTRRTPGPNQGTLYKVLGTADLDGLIRVHVDAFPGYFLTSLGSRFLELFYGEFIDVPGNLAVVALDGASQTVLGFVVGVTNAEQFYTRFYKRNWIRIIPIVFKRMLTCPETRRLIWSRLSHLRWIVKGLLPRIGSRVFSSPPSQASKVRARLLSIGVLSGHRGEGLAEGLVDDFLARMKELGVEQVGLSVFPDNTRAIAFYRGSGWHQEVVPGPSLYFHKNV